MTICASCSAAWGGLKTGHCTSCHQTFTVIAAFEKHRTGSHEREERHCLDPATVGLVDAGRAYPCWGFLGRGGDVGAPIRAATCRDDRDVAEGVGLVKLDDRTGQLRHTLRVQEATPA